MNHSHAFPIECPQVIPSNPLMKPNLLQKPLRRNIARARLAQTRACVRPFAPLLIKMRIEKSHLVSQQMPRRRLQSQGFDLLRL